MLWQIIMQYPEMASGTFASGNQKMLAAKHATWNMKHEHEKNLLKYQQTASVTVLTWWLLPAGVSMLTS